MSSPLEKGTRTRRPEAILVVAPAWVGDLVMCQTLLAVLADHRPGAIIDVLVPDWGVPLVQRMPQVRRAIALDVDRGTLALGRRLRLARRLGERKYDQAIVVKRTFKSALVPWFSRIPRRTGVRGEARFGLINDVRGVSEDTHVLNHARYAALGLEPGETIRDDALPRPSLRIDLDNRARLLARLDLDPDASPVGFAPGAAYGPAKRWPVEHWSTLARDLIREGRQVWVFGSGSEAETGEEIRRAAGPGVRNLAGRTDLVDVVDLASASRMFVSNDSGLMHLAAATSARVVALFGSTSPLNTPPLGAHTTVVWRGLDCSPCFARECPLGHLDCLTGISPREVLALCTPDPGAPRAESGSADLPSSRIPDPKGRS